MAAIKNVANAAQEKASAATDFVPNFSVGDYSRFFAAGALCATLTHGGLTPIE